MAELRVAETPAARVRAGVNYEGAGKANMLFKKFRHNFLHIIIVDLSAELQPVRLNGIT